MILLGNAGVGKTCIINRYAGNGFIEHTKPTIGVDFANKAVNKDELAKFFATPLNS